ncbi:hypothetical protein BVI1335_830065 [Burkholderia vietnamiensis]|nr:hypothetical protein BVI1335_830065 [Burkholderia vietnamiensis]
MSRGALAVMVVGGGCGWGGSAAMKKAAVPRISGRRGAPDVQLSISIIPPGTA